MDCRRGSAINSSADQDEELLDEEEEVAQFGFFGFNVSDPTEFPAIRNYS